MTKATFYVDGQAVVIEVADPTLKRKPRRVLRGWVIVLLVLAAAVLGGSLDSWADPKNSETQQEITLDN